MHHLFLALEETKGMVHRHSFTASILNSMLLAFDDKVIGCLISQTRNALFYLLHSDEREA